jgi:phosphoserine phosphatase
VCRALLVVCVAPDRESLVALKKATVATEWELTPGATSAADAVAQIEDRGAHVLVVTGSGAGEVVAAVRQRWPWMRVVAVAGGPVEGASVVVGALDGVRDAVKGLPAPGGPVRT